MRFFRELEDYKTVASLSKKRDNFDVIPDIEIPRGFKTPPIPRDAEEHADVPVEYVKKSGGRLFKATRADLPRWFIDPRVQVQMTAGMGKGCFAIERIEKNTLIESSPVILVHGETFKNLNEANGGTSKISEYPFSWGRDGLCALALGYGGIFNHDPEPNVTWRPSYEHESIQYTTMRDIEAGEELYIRYLPLNRLDSLWFSDPKSEAIAGQWRNEEITMLGDIRTWDVYRKGLP